MSAPTDDPLQVQTGAPEGTSLRVVFARVADRWTHEIQLVGQPSPVSVLRALEGGEDDRWPPGAVIQEILPQPTEAGLSVAGLGMAGKSHWSLAVTPVPGAAAVEFDVACHVKESPDWLGATYEAETVLQEVGNGCQWPVGNGWATVEPLDGTELAAPRGPRLVALQPGQHPAGLPQTIRWKYRVSWQQMLPDGLLAEPGGVEEN